ncbi:TPA: hypothetical protein HA363_01300 [Candidatus Woesearchaeota archaeon]|nr:hypothetical protein [Candidatus Woesearchaeota archaeon]
MSKNNYIYILSEYANPKHIERYTDKETDEFRITYKKEGMHITITEKNSLLEEEYGLNFKSAKYLVEGRTEIKESMIHHHQKGHKSKHLQFKLQSRKETIRIFLDNIDYTDYERCIKGFLHISQHLMQKEQQENKIEENLLEYFFNEKIQRLELEKRFLLTKISQAFSSGQITDASDDAVDKQRLLELKKEAHLKPFLEW